MRRYRVVSNSSLVFVRRTTTRLWLQQVQLLVALYLYLVLILIAASRHEVQAKDGGSSSPVLSSAAAANGRPTARDVASLMMLSTWRKQVGILMSDKLRFTTYDNGDGDDWGWELSEPLPRGSRLMKVPRSLVLDAASIMEQEGPERCQRARQILRCGQGDEQKQQQEEEQQQQQQQAEDFAMHENNFWIVVQLFRLRCEIKNKQQQQQKNNNDNSSNQWAPWLAAMPQRFVRFSPQEQACLPFYAKQAAEYQDRKLQAFCRAAVALGELPSKDDISDESDEARRDFVWAFSAVGSRFWSKVNDRKDRHSSELVPMGDMFNHRDPPNVAIVPDNDPDHVTFVYLGNNDDNHDGNDDKDHDNNTDLFISYGQPSNPHRFLIIFGFVPNANSMKSMWSHLVFDDDNDSNSNSNRNPFADKADELVFGTVDGSISQAVWDAVLYQVVLQQHYHQEFGAEAVKHDNDPTTRFAQNKERLAQQYKRPVASFLHDHVTKQLNELEELRQKMDESMIPNVHGSSRSSSSRNYENLPLIRQHNEFLSTVFGKVKAQLLDILAQEESSSGPS